MEVKPDYKSIGSLFGDRNVFEIPEYQRGYAWDKDNVSDFLDDLKNLVDNEYAEHFFGCLVCAQEEQIGGHEQVNSLIDGQQRLTTFIILAKCIIEEYQKYVGAEEYVEYINEKVKELRERYLIYKKTENKKSKVIRRMKLSRKDDEFFSRLMDDDHSEPAIDSEKRLNTTYLTIKKFISEYTQAPNIDQTLDRLESLEKCINERCNIIHLVSSKVSDAYKLFQTINDRGKALNQTDLIRAKTLGLADTGNDKHCFNDIEDLWDEFDKLYGKNLEKYLGIYFTSRTGKKVKSTTFYDQFMDEIFLKGKIQAREIKDKLMEIKKDLESISRILDGEWPYISSGLSKWKKNRLSLLVINLQHTHPVPLLLSTTKLEEKEFYKVVRTLETFFFRYKYLCGNKIDPATKIYLSACSAIQNDNFNYQRFVGDLRELMEESASEQKLLSAIDNLRYPKDSKGLKYLLLGLEENWRWYLDGYRGGLSGRERSVDTSKVYDFRNMTLEHIYPRNPIEVDEKIEKSRDSIGNITLLDPQMNSSLGNKTFEEKKKYFGDGTVLLNKELAMLDKWGESELEDRKETIFSVVKNVFRI